jgi:hypothetical protein
VIWSGQATPAESFIASVAAIAQTGRSIESAIPIAESTQLVSRVDP